jgi:hypothetical protein
MKRTPPRHAGQPTRRPGPVTSLSDPRALTLLTTEHWSLLSARSLAYNEAFVRGGMFLTFLSMSFVALGILAQATGYGQDFVGLAVLVLSFDFVIGLATYLRILGANVDDLHAVHGMARIRHGYTEIGPILERYFTTPTHDDPESMLGAYRRPSHEDLPSGLLYGLTTSGGMVGLIVSMVAGVLAASAAFLVEMEPGHAAIVGVLGGIATFGGMTAYSVPVLRRELAALVAEFPAPTDVRTDIAEELQGVRRVGVVDAP